MPRKVVHKCTLGTLPFLNIVPTRRASGERVLNRVYSKGAYGFFVMRQLDHRPSRGKIP